MENKIMYGMPCSNYIKEELKKEIDKINDKLKLVVIQIGNNPASNVYIKNKQKACEELNIDIDILKYNEDIEEEKIIDKIKELNKNSDITGIIVQLPIPDRFNVEKIINTITPLKDVDGTTDFNIGSNLKGNKGIKSSTSNGIIKLLKYYNVVIEGKHVVVINRSILVGKPLVGLLLKENATVTICHSKTTNIEELTKKADILIVAVGIAKYIKKNMIKKGSIIIDVGINRIDDKLIGDVDFDNVIDKCQMITPVPKGVGVMTVTMLIYNVVECYKLSKEV